MTEADDIATDFINVIDDSLSEDTDLIRNVSTVDGAGMRDDTATLSIPINCRIMPLSDKERSLMDFGQVVAGQRIGYFKSTYTYLSVIYTIVEDDLIEVSASESYRVQKIFQEEHLGTTMVYIKALLRRI
jgi:hypothetical protein